MDYFCSSITHYYMATKPTPNKTKPKAAKKVEKEKTNEPSFLQVVCGNLYDTLRSQKLWVSIGVIIICISLFLIISFIGNIQLGYIDQASLEEGMPTAAQNYCGRWGAMVSDYFMAKCFGIFAFCIPIFGICLALKCIGAQRVVLRKCFIQCVLWLVWGSVAASVVGVYLADYANLRLTFPLGGEHGDVVRKFMDLQIGVVGTITVLSVLALCYLIFVSSKVVTFIRTLLNPTDYIKSKLPKRNVETEGAEVEGADQQEETEGEQLVEVQTDEGALTVDLTTGEVIAETPEAEGEEGTAHDEGVAPIDLDLSDGAEGVSPEATEEGIDLSLEVGEPKNTDEEFTVEQGTHEEEASGDTLEELRLQGPYDPKKDLENYRYPSLDLLKKYEGIDVQLNSEELNANKDRIIEVLRNFGVEISSIKATVGPTITLYEITPAPGVKIAKIRNLEDDIALNLSAIGVRIIAPIPGKGTIGIEVPNQNPLIVSMESILNSKKFQESTFELPIALGKTITNEVYMVDLAKMPHLLVAGATGQGKSVGLNAIITSLLYKKHPAELKIVMVDPKKVEFSIYAPIENHFLAKIPGDGDSIITDVTKVIQTLTSLCQEMDTRYDLLKKARVRNIKEYNAKFIARQLNPEHGHNYMPYIVVVIDEFGDLIMTAGKEVELPIARIAQLARAVGMHMIIATQRPTTNIITGTIKANFPARMAFKVMSQIDSRTILDAKGADQLVGKGDMLFLAGNTPVRVQCAFVDTPEVEQICQHIAVQQSYLGPFELPEPAVEGGDSGSSEGFDSANMDPMFADAAREIVINQQGSTSLIQRRFSIGYNRAGRLMDQMEKAGIVGPTRGAKPREVYCADLAELELKLNSL